MKTIIFIFLFFISVVGYSQNNYCDIYYNPNNQKKKEKIDSVADVHTSYELRINKFHRNFPGRSYWGFSNFYYNYYWGYHPIYFHYYGLPIYRTHYWYWYGYTHPYYSSWYWGSPFRHNWYYSYLHINLEKNNNVFYGPRNFGGSTVGFNINRFDRAEKNVRHERPERVVVDYNENRNLRDGRSIRNDEEIRRDFNTAPRIYRDERNVRNESRSRLIPTERNVRNSRETGVRNINNNENQRNVNINRETHKTRRAPTSVNRSTPASNSRGTTNPSSSSRSSSSRRN